MPRSLPGAVIGLPESRTSPSVGATNPATTRSRLDLPHPDGPTITENSLSSTSSAIRSSAVTGFPLRGVKRSVTPSILSLLMRSRDRPGEQSFACELEQLVGQQSQKADHEDAEEDAVGEQS